MILRLGW